MGGPMAAPMGFAGSGPRPKVRNALLVFFMPMIIIFGGAVVAGILAAAINPMLGLIALPAYIFGIGYIYYSIISMSNELKAITQNPEFGWWKLFIPILNIIFMLSDVPNEVARAKQMMGVPKPARGVIVYFFLFTYALAADLNDIAQPGG